MEIKITSADYFDLYMGERKPETTGWKVCVQWQDKGIRYHFWYWYQSEIIEGGTIYKNANKPGEHVLPVRTLNAENKTNKPIVAEILAICKRDYLIADAIDAEKDRRAKVAKEIAAYDAEEKTRQEILLGHGPFKIANNNPRSVLNKFGLELALVNHSDIATTFVTYLNNTYNQIKAHIDPKKF